MAKDSAWFAGKSEELYATRDQYEQQEQLAGDLVRAATTQIAAWQALWQGPLPTAIGAACEDFLSKVTNAHVVVGEARRQVSSLAAEALQISQDLAVQETRLQNLSYISPINEEREDMIREGRNQANVARGELQLQWLNKGWRMGSDWQPTLEALTTMVDAAVPWEAHGVSAPNANQYDRAVLSFADLSGLTLTAIDTSGKMQAKADQLHGQMETAEGDPITYAVIDAGHKGGLDGNWSKEDLDAIADNPNRALAVLRELNEAQGWEYSEEQLVQMAFTISAKAGLLRADRNNDWEDLDEEPGFTDWFKAHMVGPIVGFGAFALCEALTGPETLFTTSAACWLGGNAFGRAYGTWANGGGFMDGLEAATDPTAIAIDATLVGGFGLFRVGRNVWVARSAPGRPSLWAEANPLRRGYVWESYFDDVLPNGFRTIDRFVEGNAVSLKTLDLTAPTYANAQTGIRALTSRVTGYIDTLADFKGGVRGNVRITEGMIQGRTLSLGVPAGGTPSQAAALQSLVDYAASKGITLQIVIVP